MGKKNTALNLTYEEFAQTYTCVHSDRNGAELGVDDEDFCYANLPEICKKQISDVTDELYALS